MKSVYMSIKKLRRHPRHLFRSGGPSVAIRWYKRIGTESVRASAMSTSTNQASGTLVFQNYFVFAVKAPMIGERYRLLAIRAACRSGSSVAIGLNSSVCPNFKQVAELANSIACSILSASKIIRPATASLASIKGPSTMTFWPSNNFPRCSKGTATLIFPSFLSRSTQPLNSFKTFSISAAEKSYCQAVLRIQSQYSDVIDVSVAVQPPPRLLTRTAANAARAAVTGTVGLADYRVANN